jgi:hypothetical protein
MRHSTASTPAAAQVASASDNASRQVDAATDVKRRRFLLTLGAGSASAVALGAVAPAAIASDATTQQGGTAGYRETAHVRDYYRTAKI